MLLQNCKVNSYSVSGIFDLSSRISGPHTETQTEFWKHLVQLMNSICGSKQFAIFLLNAALQMAQSQLTSVRQVKLIQHIFWTWYMLKDGTQLLILAVLIRY